MKNVRIFYKKTGRMKFVSHLDMNRFMTRLVNKAKLPVWFTEGFNQHAYFNFAIPLTLGFESEYEILDVKIIDDNFSNEQLLNGLNGASVEGVEFFDAAEPVLKMKEIAFSEYEILFDELSFPETQKIKSFFEQKSIITEKTTKKGGTREIDIAPLIKKVELSENKLKLILSSGNENNLNPVLVLNTLFKTENIENINYKITRTMICDKNLKPLK